MGAELPVWVFGRCRWVSGVCRRTTCQDVLEALLAAAPAAPAAPQPQDGPHGLGRGADSARSAPATDPSNYVIVERWKGVERRLDGRVRILKVWSAWGEAQAEVQLLVRRVAEKGAGRHSAAGSRRHRKRATHHGPRPSPSVKQLDQEEVHRLMRLILAQGETIAGQLRRLRERESQIERLEHETHREREARHGKDYVLAAYLRDRDDEEDDDDEKQQEQQAAPGETPRTSRQPGQPGRPRSDTRPRLLQDDLAHFADESDSDPEARVAGGAAGAAGAALRPEAGPSPRGPGAAAAPAECAPSSSEDLRARIALWEKVVKVNKRLEQQEERLVRLYVGFRRSAPDGLAVDDREQLRASLARLQQDIEDGRRSLEADAELLTETEALLDAKRRLLRRLLAEMEAADMDTARLMAVRDAARDGVNPDRSSLPPPATVPTSLFTAPVPVTVPETLPGIPCNGQLSHLPLPQSQGKGLDNDSNSDTGLSSLHSSSEEGVYILDTLV